MKAFILKVWVCIKSLFVKGSSQHDVLATAIVDDVPEEISSSKIYIVGENKHYWSVIFRCPCNCGETIQLSLLDGSSPKWEVAFNEDGTVDLSPSVWRTVGCCSHFWLRENKVSFCKEE